MGQKIPQWVWIAGLVGGGFAVYKFSGAITDFFQQFKKKLDTVTAPVTDAWADAIIRNDPYLSQPTVQSTLTGSVLFPNGALVPLTNLQVTPSGSGATFQARVAYQGRTYQLKPHDANGNYPAVAI